MPIKKLVRLVRRALGTAAVGDQVEELARRLMDGQNTVSQLQQAGLKMRYQELMRQGARLPAFEDVEFRAFSQNGEDGILLYLFALLGTTNRRSVEICAGDGIECNTANLIVNHGWIGLLVDGDADRLRRGREFYARSRDTRVWPPTLGHAWVTAENVNEVIRSHGVEGDIDLFSLDMDGVDWWVWKALEVVRPRVVVVEFQDCWPAEEAVTVPYRPDFAAAFNEHGIPAYASASLGAYVALGRRKGYRLVGAQRYGFNAFFVRNDVGTSVLPEVGAAECLQHPKVKWGVETRLAAARTMEWVDVKMVLG